jgi:hypothetical protein
MLNSGTRVGIHYWSSLTIGAYLVQVVALLLWAYILPTPASFSVNLANDSTVDKPCTQLHLGLPLQLTTLLAKTHLDSMSRNQYHFTAVCNLLTSCFFQQTIVSSSHSQSIFWSPFRLDNAITETTVDFGWLQFSNLAL